MFPPNFCGLCAQKFWCVRIFLEIHPELNRFLRPKLREDQKKGLYPELERFLSPKSLLSVLLL